MKKALFLLTACFCLMIILSSCTIGQIRDQNGENDTSLVQIDEEEILAKVPSYTQVGAYQSSTGNRVVYEAEKFSGVSIIKNIPYAVGEKLIIRSDIDLDKGNFRVVLIQGDKILCDIPLGEDKTTVIENSTRDYEIRIAGESAEFELEIEYEIIEKPAPQ